MNSSTYILLGGDGYYGRNFQYYLAERNINFIVIDNKINVEEMNFYALRLIKKHLIKYIHHDLNNKIKYNFKEFENSNTKIIIVNFAAISFVDYSILNPEETINNNVNCCINGYNLFETLKSKMKKYVYISTDEVNVNKDDDELSAYVISKRKCEDFIKDKMKINNNIYILRPVNLMDVIKPGIKELKQQNKCLLNKITNIISNSTNEKVQIHGTGEQKRMFMTLLNACNILFEICNSEDKYENIIDVVKLSNIRTCNLKIKDIVLYIKSIYNFEIEYINDPRGIYQDKTYLDSNESNECFPSFWRSRIWR